MVNDDSIKMSISDEDKQKKLNQKLEELNIKKIETDTINKARSLGIGYVNLNGIKIAESALKVIPENDAKRLQMVCFYYVPYREIRIGVVDVSNSEIIEYAKKIQNSKNTKVRIYLISEYSFKYVLEQYSRIPKITHISSKVEISDDDLSKFGSISSFSQIQEMAGKVSMTDFLNLILSSAVKFNASDIHIETEENKVVIRYRMDGVLHQVAELDIDFLKKLSIRIKILSGLKINVTDKPQDGHFSIETSNTKIDVRVSTVPSNFGESIVMRLLRYDTGLIKLESLGISKYYMPIVEREIRKPNGMIVICGPTGSGKTTTLYSILNKINSDENKIITIEDPIEYQIDGIIQTQVDAKKGYTFASGLRSLVRQDPDVILIGEMRDEETVDISINAALTGHLVLSTLHTNNAPGAIPRFLSMGAKPYLLAPALNVVIAQRLVRKLCQFCKVEVSYDSEKINEIKTELVHLPPPVKDDIGDNYVFYKPSEAGCENCMGFGYKGRIGIYEMFVVDGDIEKEILSKNMSEENIKQHLMQKGMITMVQDGIIKAIKGITSIDEIYRVVSE